MNSSSSIKASLFPPNFPSIFPLLYNEFTLSLVFFIFLLYTCFSDISNSLQFYYRMHLPWSQKKSVLFFKETVFKEWNFSQFRTSGTLFTGTKCKISFLGHFSWCHTGSSDLPWCLLKNIKCKTLDSKF